MKTMTCSQLAGACDKEFHASTFEEIGQMSKQHVMEMQADPAHVQAMETMQKLMQDPDAMKLWMDTKQKEFEALPEDK